MQTDLLDVMMAPSRRIFQIIALALLGVLNAYIVFKRHVARGPSPPEYSWLGHDFPERLPLPRDLDLVQMTAEESMLYPLGVAGEKAWRSLLTSSGGYCRLGPRNRLFAVTMFHELHCLGIFNHVFGNGTEIGHVIHCLTYLRHGALCSADVTLESGDFTRRNFTRDPVGATHECRDWSQIYEAFDENWAAWKEVSKTLARGGNS